MKICPRCQTVYPPEARYCVQCGSLLEYRQEGGNGGFKAPGNSGINIFLLTLAGSLVLSCLLIAVFKLPIFILGAILPLLWFSRRK